MEPIERVRQYLSAFGQQDRIIETAASSATVEDAARALGTEPAHIAKTMAFLVQDKPILIVAAGDVKIDNHKYKQEFSCKAHMIPGSEVEALVGYAPGGVCPYAVNEGVTVYLDVSLRRFDVVYPAAGNANSGVKQSIEDLERTTGYKRWVDVCKPMEERGA
ncbi:MAG: YbaK/EbsC family protein [Lachnospiraceae bacterium]|jgi:prolyl-tRNA editing enzyme YbaK/EbsC (Cys-tRNA(Pro) deacylase)